MTMYGKFLPDAKMHHLLRMRNGLHMIESITVLRSQDVYKRQLLPLGTLMILDLNCYFDDFFIWNICPV